MVMRNKRYIVWFWLLNLLLAIVWHARLRQSRRADPGALPASPTAVARVFVWVLWSNCYARPEFGPMTRFDTGPAMFFAVAVLRC